MSLLPTRTVSFRDYILDGLANGFRVGFDHTPTACRQSRRNMSSAMANIKIVDSYMDQERKACCLAGPMQWQSTDIQVNPLGVIPKAHQPDRWRLIVNLSSHTRLASMRALTETCVHYLIPALTSQLSTSLNWVTALAS